MRIIASVDAPCRDDTNEISRNSCIKLTNSLHCIVIGAFNISLQVLLYRYIYYAQVSTIRPGIYNYTVARGMHIRDFAIFVIIILTL
jgi:hypothetical protein